MWAHQQNWALRHLVLWNEDQNTLGMVYIKSSWNFRAENSAQPVNAPTQELHTKNMSDFTMSAPSLKGFRSFEALCLLHSRCNTKTLLQPKEMNKLNGKKNPHRCVVWLFSYHLASKTLFLTEFFSKVLRTLSCKWEDPRRLWNMFWESRNVFFYALLCLFSIQRYNMMVLNLLYLFPPRDNIPT